MPLMADLYAQRWSIKIVRHDAASYQKDDAGS